jgi:lysophospholipase L1-like esterase
MQGLGAMFLGVLLVELVLRIGFAAWVSFHGDLGCCSPGDELCKAARVYNEFIQRVPPSGVLPFDERLGHRLAPGLRNNSFSDGLNTNSAGARGVREYADTPPAGVLRIVAVGDSYVFGQEVPDAGAFPAQLEAGWKDIEVLNLGTPAYGLDQAALMLELEGLRFHPKQVVVGMIGDDWIRARSDFFCGAKPQVVRDNGSVVITGTPVPSPDEIRLQVLGKPLVLILAGNLLHRLTSRYPGLLASPDDLDDRATADAMMDRMATSAGAAGADTLFILMPFGAQRGGTYDREIFNSYCASRGASCIDTSAFFEAEGDRLGSEAYASTYFSGVHLSVAGNKAVANMIAARLGLDTKP